MIDHCVPFLVNLDQDGCPEEVPAVLRGLDGEQVMLRKDWLVLVP